MKGYFWFCLEPQKVSTMNSPFSIFFRDFRYRQGMSQQEMADRLGYEQAYLSAIELGKKSPSAGFIKKLVDEMGLGDRDQRELDVVVRESKRKYVLPNEIPTETYLLCSELWGKIDRLHPAQIRAIRDLIRIDEEMAEQPCYPARRIQRRAKEREEAKM